MKDSVCRSYDPFLHDVDRNLEMIVTKADTSKGSRASTHWIVYNAGTFHPRITTLEAHWAPGKGPGKWIRDVLRKMQWHVTVGIARKWQSFTPSELLRQNLLTS